MSLQITEHGITIPLKGKPQSSHPGGNGETSPKHRRCLSPPGAEVSVVASQLRGYGVWDGGVVREGSLLAGCGGPAPSLLFLWVTDAQANLLRTEMSAIVAPSTASGSLRDPLKREVSL